MDRYTTDTNLERLFPRMNWHSRCSRLFFFLWVDESKIAFYVRKGLFDVACARHVKIAWLRKLYDNRIFEL
jgi:hypothetical protein